MALLQLKSPSFRTGPVVRGPTRYATRNHVITAGDAKALTEQRKVTRHGDGLDEHNNVQLEQTPLECGATSSIYCTTWL